MPLDPARLRPIAAAVIAVLAIAIAFVVGKASRPLLTLPAASSSSIAVRPSPNVVVAMRDLARLDTTEYHVERVIELTDRQEHLFGLVHADDAILLVAAGDVVAGIDLSKLQESDVEVDWAKKSARVRLPKPEIFSVAIDNQRTHVVSRTTDALATRGEQLEGRARAEAESSMRQAALDAGVLDRARGSGERAVRELLRGLGFETITIE